jgi:hypothetical protein
MTKTTPPQVARIRVHLAYMPYPVWRVIDITTAATLADLHRVLQAVMPFNDSHLHQFDIEEDDERIAFGPPDPFGLMEVQDESTVSLASLIQRGVSEIIYMYDFGDSWEHLLGIEAVTDATPDQPLARFVDGAGRAPPDDCGGAPGFEHFLEAMADPKHPEHKALVRWHGRKVFKPGNLPVKDIAAAFSQLKLGGATER